MSSTRDSKSKFKNVYSNIYQMIVPAKAPLPASNQNSNFNVLKTENLNKSVQVKPYEAKNIRVPVPAVIAGSVSRNLAIQDLKKNLSELRGLHTRLRFILQELESFIDE